MRLGGLGLRYPLVQGLRLLRRRSAAGLSGLALLVSAALVSSGGCTTTTDSLGYNDLPLDKGGTGGTEMPNGGDGTGDSGGEDGTGGTGLVAGRGGSAGGGRGGTGGTSGTSGTGGTTAGTTSGSSGTEPDGGDPGAGGAPPMEPSLTPLAGRTSYPNPIRDLLGASEAEITTRITTTYDQLFHSTVADQPIYFLDADDETQAYIRDILHGDIRTEGMGLAMLISVQLGRHEEFDKLWNYSKAKLLISEAGDPRAGYFNSFCDTATTPVSCLDPYGMQQFAMSLIFAHDVWGSEGALNYEADALELLDVMLHKEERNGGDTVDGVTNVFDEQSKLVFDVPNTASLAITRPSIEMPAYYQLWQEATGNSFWGKAAIEARLFFGNAAHADTGLLPHRAYLDGKPHADYARYNPEAYRAMLNIVLDQIWTGEDPWRVTQCNKVVDFFAGIMQPGTIYELDGTVVVPDEEPALLLVNGVMGVAATTEARAQFIRYVWEFPTPTGEARYYQGLLKLYALLVLSGRMKVL